MGPKPDVWGDANEKKFLLYVAYSLGGSPVSNFAAIAEKMGDQYTVGALKNKWQRLKAEVDKDGGLSGAGGSGTASPSTPGGKIKGAGRPRKSTKAIEGDEGAEDEDAASTPGSKRKSTRVTRSSTPKSKKVKTEVESEGAEQDDSEKAEKDASKESKESGEIDEEI